jgi:lipoprotein NlpI
LLYFRGEVRRLRDAPEDAEAALADFRAALGRRDAMPETYRSMGYLLHKRGDATAARSAFARYLEIAPQAPDAAMVRSYLTESAS